MEDEEMKKIEEERKKKMSQLYGEISQSYKEISHEVNGVRFNKQSNTLTNDHTSNFNSHPTNKQSTYLYIPPHSSTHLPTLTFSHNLPLHETYLINFIFKKEYYEIEKVIQQEVLKSTSDLRLKIEINKRLNQINNDPQKVDMIGKILRSYTSDVMFIDIFTCKFIEQSKVQISRNLDLHKPFSHLFRSIESPLLLSYYKTNVIKKSLDGPGLKGVYGGFLGVLVEMDLINELWAFGAGLLNGNYNENTFIVLEVFLIVGGEYIRSKSQKQFEKLQRYIKKNVLNEITDKALHFRIRGFL